MTAPLSTTTTREAEEQQSREKNKRLARDLRQAVGLKDVEKLKRELSFPTVGTATDVSSSSSSSSSSPSSSSPSVPSFRPLHVFATIEKIFLAWDDLEDSGSGGNNFDDADDDDNGDFPADLLRHALHRCLQSLGRGHPDFRRLIFKLLVKRSSSSKFRFCRIVLLNFIPAVFSLPEEPPASAVRSPYGREISFDRNLGKRRRQNYNKSVGKEVFQVLDQIFQDENSYLSEILNCLSLLKRSTGSSVLPSDIVGFVVGLLPKVPEQYLWQVIEFLRVCVDVNDNPTEEYDEDEENSARQQNNALARKAVDAIRTELCLLEKTVDISGTESIVSALCRHEEETGTQNDSKNKRMFLEAYLDTVDDLVQHHAAHEIDNDSEATTTIQNISVFDVSILLLHSNDTTYRHRVQSIVDQIFQQRKCCLPKSSKLMEVCKKTSNGNDGHHEETNDNIGKDNEERSNISSRLQQSMSNLSVFLLLYPMRKMEYNISLVFEFVLDSLRALDVKYQQIFEDRLVRIIVDRSKKVLSTSSGTTNGADGSREWASVAYNIFRFLDLAVEHRVISLRIFRPLIMLLQDDSSSQLLDIRATEELCNVIAKVSREKNKVDHSDSLLAFQVLLCSVGHLSILKNEDRIFINRVARALFLGKAMIVHARIDGTALSFFFHTLTKMLLPQSGRMVDPSVGVQSLEILRIINDDQLKRQTLGRDGPFSIVASLLCASRIVQYHDCRNRKSLILPHRVELGYTAIPRFLGEAKDNHVRSFRKMTFQFSEFFLSFGGDEYISPSHWPASCQWVHHLINTYLSMGRTPKWNPAGWVMAAFEICSFSTTTQAGKRKRNALFTDDYFNFKAADYRLDLFQYLTEEFDATKLAVAKRELVYASIRLCCSLLLSTSLSAAVMKNVVGHFSDLINEHKIEGSSQPKPFIELMFLVRYQLLKIFDMREKLEMLEKFFRYITGKSLSTKKRKGRGRPPKSGETIKTEVDNAARQVRRLISDIFETSDYIPSEAAWFALTNTADDADIMMRLNLSKSDALSQDDFLGAVKLRLFCLRHLTTVDNSNLLGESIALRRQRSKQCLRFASLIMQRLSNVRKDSMTLNENMAVHLTNLSCAYLRLVRKVVIQSKESISDLHFFHGIYIRLLRPEMSLLDETEADSGGGMVGREAFDYLAASVQAHIGSFSIEISNELFETLSVFASCYGTNALSTMVGMSWGYLSSHSFDHNAPGHILDNAFSITAILENHAPGALQNDPPNHFGDSVVRDLLLKMSQRRYRLGQKHSFMVNALCRHWGLLSMSSHNVDLLMEHSRRMVTELVDYFDTSLRSPRTMSKSTIEGGPSTSNREEDDDDDDDDEYIPPFQVKNPRRRVQFYTKMDFPILSSSSFHVYYDVVLRLIVTTTCMYSISDSESTVDNVSKHPIRRLDELLKLFADLSRLYFTFSEYFPKTVHPSVVRTQKTMLNVCFEKIQQFIAWRNRQPVITADAVQDGVEDVASTKYLKELITGIETNVIDVLRRSESHSLRHRVEQTSARVQKISKGYGLGRINLMIQSQTASNAPSRSSNVEGEMLSPSSIRRKVSSNYDSIRASRVNDQSGPDSEDDLDYDSSESSFGVSGDWGLRNDADSLGDQDSSLVELTVTN